MLDEIIGTGFKNLFADFPQKKFELRPERPTSTFCKIISFCPDRTGLELSKTLSDSSNLSPEIFMQTLQNFTEILPDKKGIEKSLWIKKFIKRVYYSREEITLLLYYKGSEGAEHGIYASDRAEESAGRNSDTSIYKNDLFTPENSLK